MMPAMTDFENVHIKGKSLEELIDALPQTAVAGSDIHEMMKLAIQAKMVDELAKPPEVGRRVDRRRSRQCGDSRRVSDRQRLTPGG